MFALFGGVWYSDFVVVNVHLGPSLNQSVVWLKHNDYREKYNILIIVINIEGNDLMEYIVGELYRVINVDFEEGVITPFFVMEPEDYMMPMCYYDIGYGDMILYLSMECKKGISRRLLKFLHGEKIIYAYHHEDYKMGIFVHRLDLCLEHVIT